MSENFEVVISGVSGRFPECDDVDTFREKLYNQENLITYDDRKWPIDYKYKFGTDTVPLGTGKYTQIQRFDARAFACSTLLANCTDIINRKVLEPSFEAVMDAGINPTSLMGANVGCYMSSTINEVESIKIFSKDGDKLYIVGGSKAMMSNRVSFALNITGPSYTYYNGVFGGFEALTAAYQSIRDGRIEAAIVGGASSIIDPKLSLNFVKMGFLSPDGQTRSFDADANGYGRSEGAVVFFLQRAQDAKRVYANLKFSDCFYHGLNPYPLIGYSETQLLTCLKEIYSQNGNVDPFDISYLEMNACGVKRLDQVESEAVSQFFCQHRKQPLLVGSVKSNCGHLEGASSFTSLLKGIFALEHEQLAPNLNFNESNPFIKHFSDLKMKVVTEKINKLGGSLIGVNALSVSGLMGHAVIEQYKKTKATSQNTEDSLPRLLILCGRTEDGLEKVLEKVESMPLNTPFINMVNEIFRIPITTHIYRTYTILPPLHEPSNAIEVYGGDNRPIWYMFSGMGSQWNGMGKDLLSIPIFAQSINRCDQVLKPMGIDIYHILTSDDHTLFDNIVNAFVGIISVQVGLVDILNALGIVPNGIIGHSVGENACAYADGCLTLEQAVLASYARGMASNEVETVKGMMAAIGKGYNQVKDSLPEGIEVACHNSFENCTLTGPADIVNEYVKKLQDENIFAKAVNVSNIAYHSKHIAVAAPYLLKRLEKVITEPQIRSQKWISTSVPESNWDALSAKICSAEYLTNNLVSPVLFEEGCKHIPDNAVVIEIAPHGLLQAILKRSLCKSITNIPLTLRSRTLNMVQFLLSSIGKMYIAGCQPNINALYPEVEYPVPRGTPSIGTLATWDHTETFQNIGPLKYLTWHMLSILKNKKMNEMDVVFENIRVHKDLHITLEKPRAFLILIQHGSGNFEILLNRTKIERKQTIIMTGTIQVPFNPIEHQIKETNEHFEKELNGQIFYEYLQELGYNLEDQFYGVHKLQLNSKRSQAKITWYKNWVTFLDTVMKIYLYSDFSKKDLLFPQKIRRLEISSTRFASLAPGDQVSCQVDFTTHQVKCNGLCMTELKSSHSTLSNYLSSEFSKFHIKQYKFISQRDPLFKHKENYIHHCLQLIIQSAIYQSNDTNVELHLINISGQQLCEVCEEVCRKNNILKANIKFSNSSLQKMNTSNELIIAISNFQLVEKLMSENSIEHRPEYLLVSSSGSTTDTIPGYVEMTRQFFDKLDIILYKKIYKSSIPPMIINVSDEWNKKSVNNLNVKCEPVVLVHKTNDDMKVMLSKKAKEQYSNLRHVFLLNDNAKEFSLELPTYANQYLCNLPVNILKNGVWGYYQKSDLIMETDGNQRKIKNLDYTKLKLGSIKLKYLGLVREMRVKENNKITTNFQIEYSGIDTTGNRVMGIGMCSLNKIKYQPDPAFTWSVPANWSLEHASSVPLIYLQIYKALFFTSFRLGTLEEIAAVVNSDFFSFKEACIRICMRYKIAVYITVEDENEAVKLIKKFPSVEVLARTNGKGVKLAINTIKAQGHLQATTSCLGLLGYCVHVGEIEDDDSGLGLFVFLNSNSLYIIPNDFTYFEKLSGGTKRALSAMIENDLKEGVVAPLVHCLSTTIHDQENSSIKQVIPVSTSGSDNENKMQFDSNRSYIILGDPDDIHFWGELIDWLVERGARNFLICLNLNKISPTVICWTNQFRINNPKCKLLATINCLETEHDACNLIIDANKVAQLEAVFITNKDLPRNKIHNLDIASRQLPRLHFISFPACSLQVCEQRQRSGFLAVFIHCEQRMVHFSDISYQFGSILSKEDAEIYELVDRTVEEKEHLLFSLNQHLSQDLDQLDNIGSKVAEKLQFIEVTTRSKKHSETKEARPLFIIPAINSDFLTGVLPNLMYPSFCASFTTESTSVSDDAKELLQDLKRIQPNGPVTIIGETWSGCVSIELASLLQSEKRLVQLFLVEGSPFTWKNRILTWGKTETPEFDAKLLEKMAKMPRLNYLHYGPNPFDWLVNHLFSLKLERDSIMNITKAIKGIRNRLIKCANYTCPQHRLNHIVLFKQTLSESSLEKYCGSDDIYLIEEGTYSHFLKSKLMAKIIHEEALFSWWKD